jgi:hypothetical protein
MNTTTTRAHILKTINDLQPFLFRTIPLILLWNINNTEEWVQALLSVIYFYLFWIFFGLNVNLPRFVLHSSKFNKIKVRLG